jgi:hypothetical protein
MPYGVLFRDFRHSCGIFSFEVFGYGVLFGNVEIRKGGALSAGFAF